MSRYAEAHKDTKGPGDARPTALQIVEDEGLVGKLTDKVFVVTGVSSGIGIETMRALYATGGHVFGTARNLEKGRVETIQSLVELCSVLKLDTGQKAIDEVKAKTKGGEITLIEMDNESLASIKKAAVEILAKTKTLDVVVNNAGYAYLHLSRRSYH